VIDRLRREATLAGKEGALQTLLDLDRQGPPEDEMPSTIQDDRLRLIFTCCHPALSLEARVALTLRTLGGLSAPEIARAFLVPEPTLVQRLARAKRKIRDAGIPYVVPPAHQLPARLGSVLAVVYLVFNEGYSATAGDTPIRPELAAEAVRLGECLSALMPDEPEVLGLTALMLLHDSRRHARVSATGDLVLLKDQDRSTWDRDKIARGIVLLRRAVKMRRPGPYQVQAAIAALHAGAEHARDTDWPQIAALYGRLARLAPSPVVELNRAVAVAMADGPRAGLALLDHLEESGALQNYHLLRAAQADLLRRDSRLAEAAQAYTRALALTGNAAERAFLERRLAEVVTFTGARARDR
jgi:RNA polymerase sigma-70 factor, ECF subfamily